MKTKAELDQMYTDLAEQIVTPERYGNVVLAQVIEFPVPATLPNETA